MFYHRYDFSSLRPKDKAKNKYWMPMILGALWYGSGSEITPWTQKHLPKSLPVNTFHKFRLKPWEQAICEQHPAIFYGQSSFKMDFDAVFLDVYFWLYCPINACYGLKFPVYNKSSAATR